MMRAQAASIAFTSVSNERVSGTEIGESPFVRAKIGIMLNDGSGRHNTSPGSAKARIAQSSTSSEPQPQAIMSADTPTYSASAAASAGSYGSGYRVTSSSLIDASDRSAAGGVPHRLVLSLRSTLDRPRG